MDSLKKQITIMFSQGYSYREIYEILVKGGYNESLVSQALGGQ